MLPPNPSPLASASRPLKSIGVDTRLGRVLSGVALKGTKNISGFSGVSKRLMTSMPASNKRLGAVVVAGCLGSTLTSGGAMTREELWERIEKSNTPEEVMKIMTGRVAEYRRMENEQYRQPAHSKLMNARFQLWTRFFDALEVQRE